MILFPAIDLKGGQCVRLFKGEMDSARVFNDSPAAQAAEFEKAGFSWLHMVDLDGAFAGGSVNRTAVEAILKTIHIPAQLGGGIREIAHVENWLNAGVSRVILGTVAVKNPAMVMDCARLFPGRIAVGIDAREERVAVEGWAEEADIDIFTLARKFEDCGVAALIYTDITRDGTGTGLNIELTAKLAQSVNIPIIASGGVGSMADLKAVKQADLHGVIIGRALYEGKINAAEALAL